MDYKRIVTYVIQVYGVHDWYDVNSEPIIDKVDDAAARAATGRELSRLRRKSPKSKFRAICRVLEEFPVAEDRLG